MKKILIFVFIIITILLNFSCFAATKSDIINAINKTYTVNKETYTLPEGIRKKASEYINTHELTSEDCDLLLAYIDEAVAFANKLGTVNISKISKENIQKGLAIVYKAVDVLKKAPEISSVTTPQPNNTQTANPSTSTETLPENIGQSGNIVQPENQTNISGQVTNEQNIDENSQEENKTNEETQITIPENIITFEELENEIKSEIFKQIKYKVINIAIICIIIIILMIFTFVFIIKFIKKRKNTKKI